MLSFIRHFIRNTTRTIAVDNARKTVRSPVRSVHYVGLHDIRVDRLEMYALDGSGLLADST